MTSIDLTGALNDGTVEVIVAGRRYALGLDPAVCDSIRHRHFEDHADGSSPGYNPHHHHTDRCRNLPMQATLYPDWDIPAAHAHDFSTGSGFCACGAEREVLPGRRTEPRSHQPQVRVKYHAPPDDNHPGGWSYERWDDAERLAGRPAALPDPRSVLARYEDAMAALKEGVTDVG